MITVAHRAEPSEDWYSGILGSTHHYKNRRRQPNEHDTCSCSEHYGSLDVSTLLRTAQHTTVLSFAGAFLREQSVVCGASTEHIQQHSSILIFNFPVPSGLSHLPCRR